MTAARRHAQPGVPTGSARLPSRPTRPPTCCRLGNPPPTAAKQVIKNNLNPSWAPFQASYSQLCNCDPQRPLLVEVFDADLSGAHDFIGACTTSLSQLQDVAAAGQPLPLVNPKKQGKAGYTNSGGVGWRAAWLAAQGRGCGGTAEAGRSCRF